MQRDVAKKVSDFKSFLHNTWHGLKPMCFIFETDSSHYLFDTGTNKILKCNQPVYNLLKHLTGDSISEGIEGFLNEFDIETFNYAAEAVKHVIEEEKVLQLSGVEEFGIRPEHSTYRQIIDSSLEILFLELTENCNLRCGYCLYGNHVDYRRNHGRNRMTKDIAFQAIDYLKNHSYKRNEISISYYGGEPLLEFPLIKSCVEYANRIFKDKGIVYSLTTNGLAVTRKIAEFLYQNKFRVLVSLDGPEEIHNSFRRDIQGNDSFREVLRGLKHLIEVYGESFQEYVHLSMVYTPPFSEKRLDRIAQLWDEIPWLPGSLNVNITYPARGSIKPGNVPGLLTNEDKSLQQWSFEKYLKKYTDTGVSNPLADFIIERGLALLVQRPIADEPIKSFSLNGCCIPGVNRLYVTTTGDFQLCERVNTDAPTIGNVYTGIDMNTIDRTFINGYKEVITPHCSTCWAVGLCAVCYTDIFNQGKLDFNTRRLGCQATKKTLHRFLTYYCYLKEIIPKGIDYLYNYNITE